MARLEGNGWSLEIPDKPYFTVREVARLCQVQAHVLRSWERMFPQLQPIRRNGRRYYRPRDIELVMEIHMLLREKGYTITNARRALEAAGWRAPSAAAASVPDGLRQHVTGLEQAVAGFEAWLKEHAIRA